MITIAKDEHEQDLLNNLHPVAALLLFPFTRSDPDMMMLDKALLKPDVNKFIKAMEQEVADLNVDIGRCCPSSQSSEATNQSWLFGP